MKLHKRRFKYWYKKIIRHIRVKKLLKKYDYTQTVRSEFQISQFITLRLIEYGIENSNSYTNVFICISDESFPLYRFSLKEVSEILNGKNIYSCMDDACLYLSGTYNEKDFMGDPNTMFWFYCYYIKAWVECNYDWRLFRMDDSFPILRALYQAGDPKAREVFRIEMVKAFFSGYAPAIHYLLSSNFFTNYLDYFEFEEIIWLFENCFKNVEFHNRTVINKQISYYLREKGIHYLSRDNLKEAIKHLNEALKIFPFDIETLNQLSIVYLKNGDYQLAKALFIYIIDLSSAKISSSDDIYNKEYYNKPYIVEAWCNLGEVNNRLLLFSEAIIPCRMAMYLDSNHINTWDQIAIAYEGMGYLKNAKKAKKSSKKKEKEIIKNQREAQW